MDMLDILAIIAGSVSFVILMTYTILMVAGHFD